MKVSSREIKLLVLVAGIAAAVVLHMLVYKPMEEEVSSLESRAISMKQEYEQKTARIQELEEIEPKILDLNIKIEEAVVRLFPTMMQEELYTRIYELCIASEVNLQNVTYSGGGAYTISSIDQAADNTENLYYWGDSFSITFTSSYQQYYQLLRLIEEYETEDHQRFIAVNSSSIRTSEDDIPINDNDSDFLQCTMQLYFYQYVTFDELNTPEESHLETYRDPDRVVDEEPEDEDSPEDNDGDDDTE